MTEEALSAILWNSDIPLVIKPDGQAERGITADFWGMPIPFTGVYV